MSTWLRSWLRVSILVFEFIPIRLSAFVSRSCQGHLFHNSNFARCNNNANIRKVGRILKVTCASFWVIPEVAEVSTTGHNSFQGITIIGNRQTRRRRASLTVQDRPFSNPLVLSSLQKLRNVLYGLTEEHRQLDKEIDRAQVSRRCNPRC